MTYIHSGYLYIINILHIIRYVYVYVYVYFVYVYIIVYIHSCIILAGQQKDNLSLELRYENVMSHLDTINLKISDKFMMGLIFCRQNISIFKS